MEAAVASRTQRGREGWTPIRRVQHETFAVAVAKGATQADAYMEAFPHTRKWKVSSVRVAASVLASKEPVAARISALLGKALRKNQVSVERVLQERARLAFFDARKLFDEDGKPIPIHKLDDDTAAVIQGLDVEDLLEKGEAIGVVRKYKLATKADSLTALEKHLGMYSENAGEGALSIHIHLG